MSKIHAIQVHSYGDASQLRLEEISQPEPQEGEVLVRVHAAGVNALDWKIRSGSLKSVMPSTFPISLALSWQGRWNALVLG